MIKYQRMKPNIVPSFYSQIRLNRKELTEKYGFVNAFIGDVNRTIRIKGVYLLFTGMNGHFFEDYPEFTNIFEICMKPLGVLIICAIIPF